MTAVTWHPEKIFFFFFLPFFLSVQFADADRRVGCE